MDFTDGSVLTEIELDTATLQLLYIIQEALDDAAGSMQLSIDQDAWDARGFPITNVGDPTGPTDALTLGYYNDTLLPDVHEYVNGSIKALRDYTDARFDALETDYTGILYRIEQAIKQFDELAGVFGEDLERLQETLDIARAYAENALYYFNNTRRFMHCGPWRDGGGYVPYNMVEYLGSTWMLKEGDADGLIPPPDDCWQLIAKAAKDFFINRLDGGHAATEFIVFIDGGDAANE